MYPADVPIVEIKNIVAIVRNGEVKEKFKDLAHDVWVVQGYAQAMIIGHPTGDFGLVSQAEFDAVDTLEKFVASEESDDVSAQSSIPWDLLLTWLLDLLKEIFLED